MNQRILGAGSSGATVALGLMALGGALSATAVGRIVVLAGLVYLAATGKRWASWLLSFWLMLLGFVAFMGALRGTSLIGRLIVLVLSAVLVGCGVVVLRTQKGLDANSTSGATPTA